MKSDFIRGAVISRSVSALAGHPPSLVLKNRQLRTFAGLQEGIGQGERDQGGDGEDKIGEKLALLVS